MFNLQSQWRSLVRNYLFLKLWWFVEKNSNMELLIDLPRKTKKKFVCVYVCVASLSLFLSIFINLLYNSLSISIFLSPPSARIITVWMNECSSSPQRSDATHTHTHTQPVAEKQNKNHCRKRRVISILSFCIWK